LRDLLVLKDRREQPDLTETTVWMVFLVRMVRMVLMATMDCQDKMELLEQMEPREKPVLPETMVPRDPKENVASPDKRDLLVSRDRRDSRERTELRETEARRESVNPMTITLATATPTLLFDTLRILMPPTALLTTNLCGPDTLSSSSRATATDFPRILAVPDLAWRSSSLCLSCSAQALTCADTVFEPTSPSGWLSVPKLTSLSSP